MNKSIIKLESIVPHGVGGPEAGMISFIYTCLFQKLELKSNLYLLVNQIGSDLEEVFIPNGKDLYMNIRYPAYDDFEQKSVREQNLIRLDVLHQALLRYAIKYQTIDTALLEEIRKSILDNDFFFEIELKCFANKKYENLSAKLLVQPDTQMFRYYVIIEDQRREILKLLIYQGMPNDYYIKKLFGIGKWKGGNEFILSGKESEIEYHFNIDKSTVQLINKSGNNNYAPNFNLFKFDSGPLELDNYLKSLNPAIAAMIMQSQN